VTIDIPGAGAGARDTGAGTRETRPTLVYIYGPPASGKLTVAGRLSQLTGIPLFHNHLTVNALRPVFAFGSPAFTEANLKVRLAVFDVAASAGISLIFTNNSAWSGSARAPASNQRLKAAGRSWRAAADGPSSCG
jgi:hypothetical protein